MSKIQLYTKPSKVPHDDQTYADEFAWMKSFFPMFNTVNVHIYYLSLMTQFMFTFNSLFLYVYLFQSTGLFLKKEKAEMKY